MRDIYFMPRDAMVGMKVSWKNGGVMVYNINDEAERKVFKKLSVSDQMLALYEIMAHTRQDQSDAVTEIKDEIQGLRGEQASIKRRQIEFEEELHDFEKELRDVRRARERREQKLAELLDTVPPIKEMTPEQKQSTIDKLTAIVSKQDEKWMPIIRDLIRITLAALAIVAGSKILP